MLLSKNLQSDFAKLLLELIWSKVFCLVLLIIFHKHSGNSHVEYEESTHPNTSNKVEANETWAENVLVHRHDLRPAILGGTNKDSQKSAYYVIKLSNPKIKLAKVCVNPKIWVVENILGSIWIIRFES